MTQEALLELQEAAEQGVIEAMEQLGILYAEGLSVPKDADKAISYKTQAFSALKKRPLTQIGEVVEQSHGLLYGPDGLCCLLKSMGRADEARQMSTDFLKILRFTHQTPQRDCARYKGEALIDLADLASDGRPSEKRLREAESSARKALASLSEIADDEEGRYWETLAHKALGICLERQGDLDAAIEELRVALEGMEGLASRSGQATHLGEAASLSLKLGMLYKERARRHTEERSSRRAELMKPAADEFAHAVELARQAAAADPSIDNRKTLASALLQSGRLTKKRRDAVALLKEGLELAHELQKEAADGSFDALVRRLDAALDKRKGIFAKLFGGK